jgi:nitroreductase
MTRSFSTEPVDPAVLEALVDLALRAPSAGKTQGWHLVALTGADTERFWSHTLPVERRAEFRWQRLLDAPALLLVFADAAAYVARYSEPDKAATGLGAGPEAWPVPYWTVDASMAVMTLLLAAEDAGLGALFFGVFQGEAALRAELGVPDDLQLLGAIALGRPVGGPSPGMDGDPAGGPGRSSSRRRRRPDEVLHHGRW